MHICICSSQTLVKSDTCEREQIQMSAILGMEVRVEPIFLFRHLYNVCRTCNGFKKKLVFYSMLLN